MSVMYNEFFDLIKSQEQGSTCFQGYKTKFPRGTMILFSNKTMTPLAALMLHTEDPGVMALLTNRPSPAGAKESYFQGVLNMPDQTFSLGIVNLGHRGSINFNILHTPHHVAEVDPGPAYGINQVNELHPGQGYAVKVDQRTGRTMILSGLTKSVPTETGSERKVAVSVKEAEQTSQPQRQGLYFYLSVVAANDCPELVAKFTEGTTWKCADYFIRTVPKPVYRSLDYSADRSLMAMSRGSPFGMLRSRSRGAGRSLDDFGDSDEEEVMEVQSQPQMATEQVLELGNLEVVSPSNSFTVPNDYARNIVNESVMGSAAMIPKGPGASAVNKKRKGPTHQEFDTGSAQAGQLAYGSYQQVQSGFTGLEYDYDHPSDPAVLCLSIFEGLKFLPLYDIQAQVEDDMQEWINNQGKTLIDNLTKVFKSDHCVIDLESEADTVVCQCGHQCLNQKNTAGLNRCPLCRGPISALVHANGILM